MKYSPEEIGKLTDERVLSNAELINGGARNRAIDKAGHTVLDLTEKQIKEIKENEEEKEIILAEIRKDPMYLQYVSYQEQDRDIVLEAVRKDGYALQFAAPIYKMDKDIIKDALKSKSKSNIINILPNEILSDKAFMNELRKKKLL